MGIGLGIVCIILGISLFILKSQLVPIWHKTNEKLGMFYPQWLLMICVILLSIAFIFAGLDILYNEIYL